MQTDDDMNDASEGTIPDAVDALVLSEEEARVLGCLIEKALTTPEYYPLTMNALKSACNQKSNRDPVVAYDDHTLEETLETLREKHLAVLLHTADGRVPRFRHTLEQRLSLTAPEVAVVCVLLLRGPQTPGEIRGRTGRMYAFRELGEVQAALDSLMRDTQPPAVCKLPRQAGRKESRFTHLLCGEVDFAAEPEQISRPSTRSSSDPSLADRVRKLEEEIAALRKAHEDLKAELGGDSNP